MGKLKCTGTEAQLEAWRRTGSVEKPKAPNAAGKGQGEDASHMLEAAQASLVFFSFLFF